MGSGHDFIGKGSRCRCLHLHGDKQPGPQTGFRQEKLELGRRQSLVLPVPCAEEERRLDGEGVGMARDDLGQGTGVTEMGRLGPRAQWDREMAPG